MMVLGILLPLAELTAQVVYQYPVCRLKMDVPENSTTTVDGQPQLQGPGLVVLPCDGPMAARVEVWLGQDRLLQEMVELKPGRPPTVLEIAPQDTPPAQEPIAGKQLPGW